MAGKPIKENEMDIGDVKRVSVIGSGSMGHGIAQEFAVSGLRVMMHDLVQEKLDRGMQRINCNLSELAEWGVFPLADVQPALARIKTTTSFEEALTDTDLMVEAVFEDLQLKEKVFRDADGICSQRTILASNTSSLMPSSLASATKRPDRVIVTHFYNPPYLMPLVEVVRSPKTSDETVAVVVGLLKAMGKSPVVLQKEILGFIATRLQIALFREAFQIVERGAATPQDVDIAVKTSFGRRLPVAGPFEICEYNDGWDQIESIGNYVFPDLDSSKQLSPVITEMIRRKELGVKTGKGFYEWTPEKTDEWRRRMAQALVSYLPKRK
jgi:3-hydroxybutyryl-CoA dehydrogenase